MHKGNILILSNLLFNLVVALAHLYRQWETKLKVHWPLFFVHLALVIANTLLILFQVNIFFVGPASGVVCAIVVVRLLWKWLRSTRVIYSKRQFTAYCGVIYFFYVIYPVCGVIWFTSTMLPSDSLETLSQVFSLYTIAVYIYGGTQIIQTMFGLWLIVGLWSMKNGNIDDTICTNDLA
ncbi:hypothetical protein BDF22DRAFT_656200 [Syncephalis plumigaleata]|nr:hypothetical protein BDF22DRAFT_656200 [Syncephalis plumigaleata]